MLIMLGPQLSVPVMAKHVGPSVKYHHVRSPSVAGQSLIEAVTQKRAEDARKEILEHYPDVTVTYEVCGGRGVITACLDRYVVSKEFVETADSLSSPGRLVEYAHVLQAKSRLVVVVPQEKAVRTRLRLLELNNWWLFYYQIHYYDDKGDIRRVDRRTWRRMMGLPSDEPERAREVA
jgi:hypothetical protein